MLKQRLKKVAAPLIILVTIAVFIYFIFTHPQLRRSLLSTNPLVLLAVAALYGLLIICLAWVYSLTLQLCGHRLSFKENLLLTSYSTIANFFGPLQSGPGVRAAYLKQKHQVKLRDYTVATLFYYALYAIVSAIFLLLGSGQYWPYGLALLIIVAGGSLGVVQLVRRRMSGKGHVSGVLLHPRLIGRLFLATVCQLSVVAVIYYVELQAVHTHASFSQTISYAGAANFSLFVSLTPGAIGFREAFLAFSQRLHHIGSTDIIAANLIDRAVFVAFLGGLFLLVLASHAKDRFTPATDSGSV